MINIKALCKKASLPYWTVYFWTTGRYEKDLHKLEKTALANALAEGVKPLLKALGYEMVLKPVKK